MADYKTMYIKLFNAVTDAVTILQKAQTETEQLFIEQKEQNITIFNKPNDSE